MRKRCVVGRRLTSLGFKAILLKCWSGFRQCLMLRTPLMKPYGRSLVRASRVAHNAQSREESGENKVWVTVIISSLVAIRCWVVFG